MKSTESLNLLFADKISHNKNSSSASWYVDPIGWYRISYLFNTSISIQGGEVYWIDHILTAAQQIRQFHLQWTSWQLYEKTLLLSWVMTPHSLGFVTECIQPGLSESEDLMALLPPVPPCYTAINHSSPKLQLNWNKIYYFQWFSGITSQSYHFFSMLYVIHIMYGLS